MHGRLIVRASARRGDQRLARIIVDVLVALYSSLVRPIIASIGSGVAALVTAPYDRFRLPVMSRLARSWSRRHRVDIWHCWRQRILAEIVRIDARVRRRRRRLAHAIRCPYLRTAERVRRQKRLIGTVSVHRMIPLLIRLELFDIFAVIGRLGFVVHDAMEGFVKVECTRT